ncbi:extracellular solute-binding protein [Deinococcus yavapaiensis]|uniref:Carbohydrate ABC transporter substrate-binding protein (CUT1 family) n=1 Tax=Deinococcus yavapaiensis KR-236 TaxID=694435 RepID=A0A318SHE2_9DEIO|nr:extracellular solute-binding protein [Deinococcus yavapaiensis]PYE50422.1 carbohydrate ABC transporter substrate-binding protein (CUT1 family) [Deinococcus yavapaiensis KR-236]
MKKALKLLGLSTLLSASVAAAQDVTITYWQYEFASKVTLMNKLIARFEAQNPGIKVKQETFPYDAYNQKVATSIPAGQGPDVVNLFYGWLPQYVDGGYLQALPAKDFPVRTIDANFVPMVKTSKIDGKYYALPTAVRTLAIFYNKELFKQAGIRSAPRTWNDFLTAAQKITKGAAPRFTTLGFAMAPDGQDYHVLREVLLRQYGGRPYSADGKQATYDTEAGVKALTFYADLVTKYKVGVPNFFPGNNAYRDAFIAGRAGMIIDGSFAIGSIRSGAKFDWGVATLPVMNQGGQRGNFGSYWVNGITKNARGAKLDASVKFLKFLTSEEVMREWLRDVGEIPASRRLSSQADLRKDPVYGPFVQSLPFATSTLFVDEAGQRRVWVDAINSVILEKGDPAAALKRAVAEEQKILNDYYKK